MTPPVLWTPPDSLLQRASLGAYRRERGFDTYDELWRWSVSDLDGFWGSIWDRFGVGERGDTVLASESMPGAQWFPGTLVNYAEHAFRGKDDDALRDHRRRRGPRGRGVDVGGSAGVDAEDRGRTARAGRRARRPRRRLHAEHPRDRGGVPGLRFARRRLVVLLAGLRRPQRDRPLRADRAEGAARDPPLPLRRARIRPHRGARRDRRRDAGAAGARRSSARTAGRR